MIVNVCFFLFLFFYVVKDNLWYDAYRTQRRSSNQIVGIKERAGDLSDYCCFKDGAESTKAINMVGIYTK